MKTYKKSRKSRKAKGRNCPTKRRKHLGGWLGRIRGVSGTIDKYIYATDGSNEERDSYSKMASYKEDVIKYLDKLDVIVRNIYKKNPYTIEQLLRLQTLIKNLVSAFDRKARYAEWWLPPTNEKIKGSYNYLNTLIGKFIEQEKIKEMKSLADSKKPTNPATQYLPNVGEYGGLRRRPMGNSNQNYSPFYF